MLTDSGDGVVSHLSTVDAYSMTFSTRGNPFFVFTRFKLPSTGLKRVFFCPQHKQRLMKNDDLIIKYAHHFSVTECNQLSRDSTPYLMTAMARMGVGFDSIDNRGYKIFNFKPTPRSNRTKILSHRMIFYIRNGYLPECVDHSNRDALDNSTENLRGATKSQNAMNRRSNKGSSSRFLGVSLETRAKKWRVQIQVNDKKKHIGYFTTETEAAHAYNLAAAKHFGEFVNLNVIPSNE